MPRKILSRPVKKWLLEVEVICSLATRNYKVSAAVGVSATVLRPVSAIGYRGRDQSDKRKGPPRGLGTLPNTRAPGIPYRRCRWSQAPSEGQHHVNRATGDDKGPGTLYRRVGPSGGVNSGFRVHRPTGPSNTPKGEEGYTHRRKFNPDHTRFRSSACRERTHASEGVTTVDESQGVQDDCSASPL
jgi:hypothetical protein